ncbi:extensin family protein [Methylocystis sp. SC2]|uniref:extensin-like domain-containing protein n=1 Tax=Methylocystis sp. (strain SC2) TaxID=187303 RepID=UPI00027AEAD6|nr:extensin family protein [Methylocystis sp. SC2]CCJ07449.1 Extensin family protein [Methylocystis sp. SC2]
MVRRAHHSLLVPALVATTLSGCSIGQKPQRPAWRTQAENACLAERRVNPSEYIALAPEVDGPGICGLTRPFKVTALQGGAVAFNATATLDCSMVAELDAWLADTVQPAAQARFGQQVVQINSMGSYACRGMNNQRGAQLSEHSFGNALDIGGFALADGREITLVRDWGRGDPQTRAFLMDVHRGACGRFSTVLSPGSNAFHYNHIHVDLALHGRSGRSICKPEPQETLPPPESSPLVAQGRAPAPGSEEETDNDTTGKPPLAAFEGPGVGARDGLGSLAGPEAYAPPPSPPLPPRRDGIGQLIDDSDQTSSIGRGRRL